ncbi:hypothetical protein ANOM_000984 [Aspergillus nomiae NRRL 13137]|uniref:Uncharacterized protein n=1 Tax=Aspergillus nomiae NRRL (strain ATCC 15546 / NRRL 13137 / CBS 260.88 / M93) TaxID=1509407 RepID=A0A0L1JGK6_ASPN3|nr:uncharacterized protein ANOM_000984 [Aspergillus nomiae NRRL 13137]KNG90842.1 hypothetical protein ANOM_000984 [Aspergillus nomiae NRRL 13137]
MDINQPAIQIVAAFLIILILLLASVDKRKLAPYLGVGHRYISHALSRPLATSDDNASRSIAFYKTLYHRLQNLEQYPGIQEQGRQYFVTWISDALNRASHNPARDILSVEQYSREALLAFVQSQQEQVTDQFEAYHTRRRKGGQREHFPDRDAAIRWLRQASPLKLVDGAWLGHINGVSTPFNLRPVSKGLWQILSEELGDGDRKKHHVFVYQELLRSVGHVPPCPSSSSFIQTDHGADDVRFWQAAVAHLLISLAPDCFLPELLGFNLCFEGLQLDTLVVATELREVGIDPYYFLLHISIDNVASGHTAMAAECVIRYLDHVRDSEGTQAMDCAWKRIQAGFVFCGDASSSSTNAVATGPSILTSKPDLEGDLLNIFASKVNAARGIHCTSKARIGSRTMVDWLEPTSFRSREWQQDFLRNLTDARPWVYKGDSQKSKLVQELRWGGRMFGCFTDRELGVLERWIDTLYHTTVVHTRMSEEETELDMAIDTIHQANIGRNNANDIQAPSAILPTEPGRLSRSAPIRFRLPNLLPLWFMHGCLLEGFVYAPALTTSEMGCAVIRILRAQMGFAKEGPVAAGMDEMSRMDSPGIIEMGLELMKRMDLPSPGNITDILQAYPSDFAERMNRYAMAPVANFPLLLGILLAFIELQEKVVVSDLLSRESSDKLADIVLRERDSLQVCHTELERDRGQYAKFCSGYQMGRANVDTCLEVA